MRLRYKNPINSMGMSRVYNTNIAVNNQELSPHPSPERVAPVDSCVQRGAPRKPVCAGETILHPQSTALINRTILKYKSLMSITSHEFDKGRTA
jgi:hypothetical protein